MENLSGESLSVLASDTESEETQDLPEEALDILFRPVVECPICVQIPSGKVYQCNNSHIICDRCFDQLTNDICPQGRCSYKSPEPRRNRAVEEIIEKCNFTLDCPNEGCKMRMKARNMREHEKVCPERNAERNAVLCFVSSACGKIPLDKLDAHLIKEHSDQMDTNYVLEEVEDEELLWDLNNLSARTFVSRFSLDNHYFYKIETRDSEYYYEWVVVNGDRRLARKYAFTVSMYKWGTTFGLLANLPVLSVRDASLENALDAGCCLQVSRKKFISLCSRREEENIEEGSPDQSVQHCVDIKQIDDGDVEMFLVPYFSE